MNRIEILIGLIQLTIISAAFSSKYVYSDSEDDVIIWDSCDNPDAFQQYSSIRYDEKSKSNFQLSMNYESRLRMMPKAIKKPSLRTISIIFQVPISTDSMKGSHNKLLSRIVRSESSTDDDFVLDGESDLIKSE